MDAGGSLAEVGRENLARSDTYALVDSTRQFLALGIGDAALTLGLHSLAHAGGAACTEAGGGDTEIGFAIDIGFRDHDITAVQLRIAALIDSPCAFGAGLAGKAAQLHQVRGGGIVHARRHAALRGVAGNA